MRVAMWSGPRNISTALLRSWGNRADTWVTDEPLYGHYLRRTGLSHPGGEAIMRNIRERDYGLRTLVHEVVKSKLFQNK